MTRRTLGAVMVLAITIDGCACETGDPEVVDAAIDPSIDARLDAPVPDAWELIDIGREDGGPDAEGSSEDPCLTAPRGEACARELLRRVDAARCEGERACGRPIGEDGCEIFFPAEGSWLLRASEEELTLVRLGLLEIVPETAACLAERVRTCSTEDPATCGTLFRPVGAPMEGDVCRDDAECGPSMYCDGIERERLPPGGELCVVGTCTLRVAAGEPCAFFDLEPTARPVGPCVAGSVCWEGTCTPIVDGVPAAPGERCNAMREEDGLVYRYCAGSARCAGFTNEQVCYASAELGQACGEDIYCSLDAECRAGVCVPGIRFGGRCGDHDGWCIGTGFGSACIDGICVPNARRLGEECFHGDHQPCVEGVCAPQEDDPTNICQPSLRSAPGGYCRRNDDDCVGGVCCWSTCVAVGDGPVS